MDNCCLCLIQKDMDLDLMDKANAKAMFKKFVKHWNKKKLDEVSTWNSNSVVPLHCKHSVVHLDVINSSANVFCTLLIAFLYFSL